MNAVLKRGGTVFATVTPVDPRLSASMRLALLPEPPIPTEGAFEWRVIRPGVETAEMPVLAAGQEVDRILLARIEPARFRFEVLTHPAGNRDLDDWMRITSASLIVNGSYFDRYGLPTTPLKSEGVAKGPSVYQASHGIFTVSKEMVTIVDLAAQDWKPLLNAAEHAMVSYPLLLSEDGTTRVKSERRKTPSFHWSALGSFSGHHHLT